MQRAVALILALAMPAHADRVFIRRHAKTPAPALRIVIGPDNKRTANCVFSTEEIAENAPPSRTANVFSSSDAVWARCFLPKPIGKNKPGDLYDVITVDGRRAWEQAYDTPLLPSAISHLVPYHVVFRALFAGLSPGDHNIAVEGLRRGGFAGGEMTTVYRGSFTLHRVR